MRSDGVNSSDQFLRETTTKLNSNYKSNMKTMFSKTATSFRHNMTSFTFSDKLDSFPDPAT